jgi:hypothetical protein
MRVVLTLDDIPLFDSADRNHADSAVKALAVFYAGLDDDEQAQFFEEVGRAMLGWGEYKRDLQAGFIGRHIGTCACIGEAGREFLKVVYETSREASSAAPQPLSARVEEQGS